MWVVCSWTTLWRYWPTHAMDERCNDSHALLVNPTEESTISMTSSIHSSYHSAREVDVSHISIASSSSSGFRRTQNAAEKLNRELLFGESERPDDLDEDWCYVSDKNANKRQFHSTRWVSSLTFGQTAPAMCWFLYIHFHVTFKVIGRKNIRKKAWCVDQFHTYIYTNSCTLSFLKHTVIWRHWFTYWKGILVQDSWPYHMQSKCQAMWWVHELADTTHGGVCVIQCVEYSRSNRMDIVYKVDRTQVCNFCVACAVLVSWKESFLDIRRWKVFQLPVYLPANYLYKL